MIRKLLALNGWPRVALMTATGVLAALALAPVHAWPLLPLSYGLLLHAMLRADSARECFRLGWWWGLGYFIAGLYWICISMTVDLARFGWMIPFALLGLNGGLALFPAVAGWVFGKIRRNRHDVVVWLLFALLMASSEWLRGHILTGFPWNLAGYAWGASDASIQIASLLPIYPLTFITILFASSLALLRYRWPILACVACFALMLGYSREQLKEAQPPQFAFSARLVQGNIAQSLKQDAAFAQQSFARQIELSQSSEADYIIWSESALPYPINLSMPFPHHAFAWLKPEQTLITGAVIHDANAQAYNSIVAIRAGEGIASRYNKQHLVPFGEYVPLRGLLPIEKLTAGIGDFAKGSGSRELLDGLFHPLICYEVIFAPYAKGSGGVLLNLTNDAWFGHSSGPYQHLMMARFRAVEQRKPLLRVANTGISAVIDAHGRVQQFLPLGHEGVIDIK